MSLLILSLILLYWVIYVTIDTVTYLIILNGMSLLILSLILLYWMIYVTIDADTYLIILNGICHYWYCPISYCIEWYMSLLILSLILLYWMVYADIWGVRRDLGKRYSTNGCTRPWYNLPQGLQGDWQQNTRDHK